jgi:hypothetical protein
VIAHICDTVTLLSSPDGHWAWDVHHPFGDRDVHLASARAALPHGARRATPPPDFNFSLGVNFG